MKKLLMLIIALLILVPITKNNVEAKEQISAEGKSIAEIIPDENFRNHVIIILNERGMNNKNIDENTILNGNEFMNIKYITSEPHKGEAPKLEHTELKKSKNLQGIEYFTNLESLTLKNGLINEFPNEIFQLDKLLSIDLHNLKYVKGEILDDFAKLEKLHTVNLTSLGVSNGGEKIVLPKSLFNSDSITTLTLHQANIEYFDRFKIPNAIELVSYSETSTQRYELPSNFLDLAKAKGNVKFYSHGNSLKNISVEEYELLEKLKEVTSNKIIVDSQKYNYPGQTKVKFEKESQLTADSLFSTISQLNENEEKVDLSITISGGSPYRSIEVSKEDHDKILTEDGVVFPENMYDIIGINNSLESDYKLKIKIKDTVFMNSEYTFSLKLNTSIDKKIKIIDTDTKDLIKEMNVSGIYGDDVDIVLPKIDNYTPVSRDYNLDVVLVNESEALVVEYEPHLVNEINIIDSITKTSIAKPIYVYGLLDDKVIVELPDIDGYYMNRESNVFEHTLKVDSEVINIEYIPYYSKSVIIKDNNSDKILLSEEITELAGSKLEYFYPYIEGFLPVDNELSLMIDFLDSDELIIYYKEKTPEDSIGSGSPDEDLPNYEEEQDDEEQSNKDDNLDQSPIIPDDNHDSSDNSGEDIVNNEENNKKEVVDSSKTVKTGIEENVYLYLSMLILSLLSIIKLNRKSVLKG